MLCSQESVVKNTEKESESDEFNDIMADNNDLFPMSIGELAGEWLRLAVGERGTEVERSDDSE